MKTTIKEGVFVGDPIINHIFCATNRPTIHRAATNRENGISLSTIIFADFLCPDKLNCEFANSDLPDIVRDVR
jgi:hypothetical protein